MIFSNNYKKYDYDRKSNKVVRNRKGASTPKKVKRYKKKIQNLRRKLQK